VELIELFNTCDVHCFPRIGNNRTDLWLAPRDTWINLLPLVNGGRAPVSIGYA